MDKYKEDKLEFLDLTGVEDNEKRKVLTSLHCGESSLKLPWATSKNLPVQCAKAKPRKMENKLTSANIPPINSSSVEVPLVMPQHFEQQPFQPVFTVAPKFSVQPAQFSVGYTFCQVPPVYTTYPLQNPNTFPSTPSTTVTPTLIYPSEPPGYAFHNVPVTLQFNNAPSFSSLSHYPTTPPLSSNDAVSNATPAIHQPAILNNVATRPPVFLTPNQNCVMLEPTENVNFEQLGQIATSLVYPSPPVVVAPIVKHDFPNIPIAATKSCASSETQCDISSKTSDLNIDHKQNGLVSSPSTAQNQAVHVVERASSNKSWASLFGKSPQPAENCRDGVKSMSDLQLSQSDKESPIKHPKKSSIFIDPTCYRMAEYLIEHNVDGKTISLQPRGLINKSNYCYINSILQALMACPPFYNLMAGLAKNLTSNEKRKPTPVIDNVCKLINEFDHLPAGLRVGRRIDKNQKKDQGVAINCDTPFEPLWIYKMLNGMKSDAFLVEGRQEDAEEFFGCLLNGLNDEMQELIRLIDNESEEVTKAPVDKDDWQVMGPRNKSSITRKAKFNKTPISNIFGGLLRSRIHRAGDESTNNIQPFFTLQLNIEKVKSVGEALEALVSKNQLEGITSSKTNEQVQACHQVTIEELPIILVLHLKCFDYQLDGCTKIMKALEFPIDLKIDSKLLSSKINSMKERQYKLFAVVYHEGKEASKGHYITDCFHVGYNSWLRYDDASVKSIPEEHVLIPQGTRVPYLLFYRRSDTIIRSK